MPAKRKPVATPELSRLTVLAAGDEKQFADHALELIASGERLAREAALAALVERPVARTRERLRDLFFELHADGLKRDQGAIQRVDIVRILRALGDIRDADIALSATDAFEKLKAFDDDLSWRLRAEGLMMLAETSADLFPYVAVEHLDDNTGIDGAPASIAFQLLAGLGHFVPLYQWLMSSEHLPRAEIFELLARGAPRDVVSRYVASTIGVALRREDEVMLTTLAESIVNLEMEDSYAALGDVMSAKISDELYGYLAVLVAGTNRAPLLAILDWQLHRGRRPKLVEQALRVRTTREQQVILDRWQKGE